MRPNPTKADVRLSKKQENKSYNKQRIGKQHADNQSEEKKSLRGGKGEKEEEIGGEFYYSMHDKIDTALTFNIRIKSVSFLLIIGMNFIYIYVMKKD